ncbi:hypothetical protein D3C85_1080750 [compost metagenome]
MLNNIPSLCFVCNQSLAYAYASPQTSCFAKTLTKHHRSEFFPWIRQTHSRRFGSPCEYSRYVYHTLTNWLCTLPNTEVSKDHPFATKQSIITIFGTCWISCSKNVRHNFLNIFKCFLTRFIVIKHANHLVKYCFNVFTHTTNSCYSTSNTMRQTYYCKLIILRFLSLGMSF